MKENNIEFWATRHSLSGKGVESAPGLSEQGVGLARERAKIIAEFIEEAEPGTVIFHGGATNYPRTRSTLEIYTNELKEQLKDKENIIFVNKEDIQGSTKESGYLKTADKIVSQAQNSPEAKVVIDLPLRIKEFFKENDFVLPDGKMKPQWQGLLDKYGKDYSGATKEWFSSPEFIGEEGGVPRPEKVAQDYLTGIKRLENFTRRFFPDRPLKITFVGHSFVLDAFLTYLANNGKITKEGFEKIGGEAIKETELAKIGFDKSGNLALKYRGKEFFFENKDR